VCDTFMFVISAHLSVCVCDTGVRVCDTFMFVISAHLSVCV